MSEQTSFFDIGEAELGRQRIAEMRQILAGERSPAADPDSQRAAREDAIEAIGEASTPWRVDTALPFIRNYLETHATLFGEDLWAAGLPEPHDRKALGPAIREAARRGWMEQSGQTRISAQNANPKPIWRSLLCDRDAGGDN